MTLKEMKKIMNEEMRRLVIRARHYRCKEVKAENFEDKDLYKLLRIEYEERAYEVARLMYNFMFVTYEQFEQITSENTDKIYILERGDK